MAAALPFLFMGCWNRRGVARDRVLESVCADPCERFVLGGDNIYPEKSVSENGKKTKVYDRGVLTEGLGILGGCKTILGSALGNHNVSDPRLAKSQIGVLTPADQTYFVQDYSDVSLVFLDTNLSGTELETMLVWLSTELGRLQMAGRTYYLIQHEPVIGFKKAGVQALLFGNQLLDVLVLYPPLAILCADTHHYQEGLITYKGVDIHQYIVGTGGAAPDSMTSDASTIDSAGVHYARLDFISGYGYARVSAAGVEFVKVAEWSIGGGGQRRTRRASRAGAKRQQRKSSRTIRR